MTDSDEDLLREMEELRQGFLDGLGGRVESLRRSLVSLADHLDAGWPSTLIERFRADAHKLRGTAGCYGEDALGDAAGVLEDLLLTLVRSGSLSDISTSPSAASSPNSPSSSGLVGGSASMPDASDAATRAAMLASLTSALNDVEALSASLRPSASSDTRTRPG